MSIAHFYDPLFDLGQFLLEGVPRPHVRTPLASCQEPQGARMLEPRMDLHEDPDKNLATATFELPGLSKDKVNIDMQNGKLIISGEVFESTERNGHEYSIRERRTGGFSRSVKLPEGTKPQDIKAAMENGVLTVTFPKSSPGQEPRRIDID